MTGDLKIEAKWSNRDKVKAALDKARRACEPESFMGLLERGIEEFQSAIAEKAPKKTYALINSARKQREDAMTWHVAPDIVYAWIQDQGGTIRGKPWLVFQGQSGETVFARSVTLSKNKGYMERAFRAGTQDAIKAVDDALVRKLFGS